MRNMWNVGSVATNRRAKKLFIDDKRNYVLLIINILLIGGN